MTALHPIWPDAPRHAPWLTLPRYRFVPEDHPHPRKSPDGSLFGQPEFEPGLPADRWRDDRSYLAGIDLYHQGYLWEAHEAWEACFHAAEDPAHKALLQALIQLAAALLNVHRGKGQGVLFLADAVVRRLRIACDAAQQDARMAGLDPRALLTDVERHLSGALAPAATADTALRTTDPAPRLELPDAPEPTTAP